MEISSAELLVIPDSDPGLIPTSPVTVMAAAPVLRRTYGRVQKPYQEEESAATPVMDALLTRSDTMGTVIPDSDVSREAEGTSHSPQKDFEYSWRPRSREFKALETDTLISNASDTLSSAHLGSLRLPIPASEETNEHHLSGREMEETSRSPQTGFEFPWRARLRELNSMDSDTLISNADDTVDSVHLEKVRSPNPVSEETNTFEPDLSHSGNLNHCDEVIPTLTSNNGSIGSNSPPIYKRRRLIEDSSEDEKGSFQSFPEVHHHSTPGTSPENKPRSATKSPVIDWSDMEEETALHLPAADGKNVLLSGSPHTAARKRSKAGRLKTKEHKIKPLTKKELAETKKETARLLAQRNLSIPQQERRPRLALSSLFKKLQRQSGIAAIFPSTSSSDISQFSPTSADKPCPSPIKKPITSPSFTLNPMSALAESSRRVFGLVRRTSVGRVENDLLQQLPREGPRSPRKSSGCMPSFGDSFDEDLPSVNDICRPNRQAEKQKADLEAKVKAAQAIKAKALAAGRTALPLDDDDDLEVVEVDHLPLEEGRTEISKGKRRQLTLAGIRAFTKPTPASSGSFVPAGVSRLYPFPKRKSRNLPIATTHQEMNSELVQKIHRQGSKIRQEKEQLWLQKGGKAKGVDEPQIGEFNKLLEKGAQVRVSAGEPDEDSDADDDDWVPGTQTTEENVAEGVDEGGREPVVLVPSTSFILPPEVVEHGHHPPTPDSDEGIIPRVKGGRKPIAVMDSDDEEPYHTYSGGSDAENLHPSDGENVPLSTEPTSSLLEADGSPLLTTGCKKNRKVLETLHYETPEEEFDEALETPSRPRPPQPLFIERLSQLSVPNLRSGPVVLPKGLGDPFESKTIATSGLQAPFGHDSGNGFSQFFDDNPLEVDENAPPPITIGKTRLRDGGLTQLFSSPERANPFGRKALSTLSSVTLSTPSDEYTRDFFVSGTQAKRDETLLLDGQAQLMKESRLTMTLPTKSPQPLFMNSQGLLTQSRPQRLFQEEDFATQTIPELSTPSVLECLERGSPTKEGSGSPLGNESSTQRTRLFRRLPRRQDHHPSGNAKADQSPRLAVKRTAFDILMARTPQRLRKEKKKPRSEFVEGEAVESDDDALMGFGGPSRDDDEESEDDNTPVEHLLDDAEMSTEAKAADLVQEKYQEQIQEDDAEVEKLHKNAIAGKLRHKRRDRGLGFEDSDSDVSEEDEARRIRRRMHKKRRIEGDSLDALAKSDETRAFYNAYQMDLDDEEIEEDFHHLNSEPADVGSGDEEIAETVESWDLQEQLRQAARHKSVSHYTDPEDVSWVDDQEDDSLDYNVDDLGPGCLTKALPLSQDALDMPVYRKTLKLTDHEDQRLTKWAKEDSHYRSFSTSGRGSTAVTGHAPGATSSRNGSQQPRIVPQRPTILASVLGKGHRFD